MRPIFLALCVLAAACSAKDKTSDTAGSEDAASDGGESDGGATDGGASDGGSSDGGGSDGGGSDGGGSDGGGEVPVVHELDPDTLAAWLADEQAGGAPLLLINTHTPNAGEIPGTDVHIVYSDGGELVAGVGDDLDRLTVVYCLTGPMSVTAANTLVDAGYTNIWDLPGGMRGWEAAGYEITD